VRRTVIAKLLGGALLALCLLAGGAGWYLEHRQVGVLQERVAELQKNELQSKIDKSVSDQLGEIASQQKEIAEEKREEALKEKMRADDAFLRSEIERQKAEQAGREARMEKEKAEEERQKADEARQKAELSERMARLERNKADTLRYQALGRSLGSASRQAFSANQLEMAQLLALYSYHYTTNYGGVVYFPDVFQALLNASHSIQSWGKHRGQLRSIYFMPERNGRMITVCDYGSILIHTKKEGKFKTDLKTDTLLNNQKYDFRYVYADKQSVIYAVSRSGHLVVSEQGNRKRTRIISVLEGDNPFALWAQDNNQVLVVGNHSLALVDLSLPDDKSVVDVRQFDCKIISQSHKDGKLMLFDNHHRQHLVNDFRHIETSPIPVQGIVTAFSSTKGMSAYGMEDGSIYLLRDDNKSQIKLLGHESRISELKLNSYRLYSSGYDGKVNFWYINSEKIEPMELISKQCWILDFTVSADQQHIWIGDKNGTITEALLDAKKMKDIIEAELRNANRDLTEEEWNYYIGKDTPYAPVILGNGKEVRK
jgi:hypothetical protein